MAVPILVPTSVRDETFGGVRYHIEGELVPVLQVELAQMPIYFEHHILLWKDPTVEIGQKTLGSSFKRMLAGMPVFMTETRGTGRIGLSRDGAGQVLPIHLHPGQTIDVREHQFLAATDAVDYTVTGTKGAAKVLVGGTGFFIDTFSCPRQEGVVWLHGFGNVFEATLQPGEQIDIEPGGWLYKDRSVQMERISQPIDSSFFASAGNLFWHRFTGPGRVGLQSMVYPPQVAGNS